MSSGLRPIPIGCARPRRCSPRRPSTPATDQPPDGIPDAAAAAATGRHGRPSSAPGATGWPRIRRRATPPATRSSATRPGRGDDRDGRGADRSCGARAGVPRRARGGHRRRPARDRRRAHGADRARGASGRGTRRDPRRRRRRPRSSRAGGARGRWARDALRVADDRLRAADRSDLEARLGRDALREQLLVELAGLGSSAAGRWRPRPDRRWPSAPARSRGRSTTGTERRAPTTKPGRTRRTRAGDAAALAALDAAAARWAVEPVAADIPGPGRLATLRRRYHELGAANPFAVEEYQELRERLELLETQQGDLRSAIDKTRQLIAELNTMIATSSDNVRGARERRERRRNWSAIIVFSSAISWRVLSIARRGRPAASRASRAARGAPGTPRPRTGLPPRARGAAPERGQATGAGMSAGPVDGPRAAAGRAQPRGRRVVASSARPFGLVVELSLSRPSVSSSATGRGRRPPERSRPRPPAAAGRAPRALPARRAAARGARRVRAAPRGPSGPRRAGDRRRPRSPSRASDGLAPRPPQTIAVGGIGRPGLSERRARSFLALRQHRQLVGDRAPVGRRSSARRRGHQLPLTRTIRSSSIGDRRLGPGASPFDLAAGGIAVAGPPPAGRAVRGARSPGPPTSSGRRDPWTPVGGLDGRRGFATGAGANRDAASRSRSESVARRSTWAACQPASRATASSSREQPVRPSSARRRSADDRASAAVASSTAARAPRRPVRASAASAGGLACSTRPGRVLVRTRSTSARAPAARRRAEADSQHQ